MLTVFALILMKCLYLEAKLFGDHVCQTDITEPREVLYWELKNRTVRTYKWCMNVPPRCSVYSHKIFNETNISVINETKSIETCCEGFYEQNSYCMSMCQDCKNGLCLKGTCICQSGWEGPNCDSRALNSNEELVFPSSSTIHLKKFWTTENPTERPVNNSYENVSATIPHIQINDTDISLIENNMPSSLNPSTSISTSTDFKENAVSSSTNVYSSLATSTRNTVSPSNKEDMLNYFNGNAFDLTSQKNNLEFSQEPSFTNYATSTKEHDSQTIDEESSSLYTTDRIYFDTTATQQTVITSTVLIENGEIVLSTTEESSKKISINGLNSNYSITATMTTLLTNPQYPKVDDINPTNAVTKTMLENLDLDVDYRELGGQSLEEKSMESPKVLQNGIDKNDIHLLNVQKTTRKNYSYIKNVEDIEETSTQNILETIAPVLSKPNTARDEKENSIFKGNVEDSLDDFTEERYQKRSSNKNYSRNTILAKNDMDNNNLIYSVCAASATTVLILIVAIVVFTLRSARKKLDKNKGKKNVASVAVYTSIFHSPLPDPPTFENPTYLSTGGNENWNKESNEEVIEVQEFNVVFQKPLKNPKLEECEQYVYDHPPSTGSYRASSEVDTLSQYNLSHKSLTGIILEPVYDEIPSRDSTVEMEGDVLRRSSIVDTPKNRLSYLDNNSLYVNTFGRTKF